MSRLKLVSAKKMEKLLFHLGFEKVRQKESHAFYRHSDGRTTTLPHHGNRMLLRPLLREIIREIEVTIEQYDELLENSV